MSGTEFGGAGGSRAGAWCGALAILALIGGLVPGAPATGVEQSVSGVEDGPGQARTYERLGAAGSLEATGLIYSTYLGGPGGGIDRYPLTKRPPGAAEFGDWRPAVAAVIIIGGLWAIGGRTETLCQTVIRHRRHSASLVSL